MEAARAAIEAAFAQWHFLDDVLHVSNTTPAASQSAGMFHSPMSSSAGSRHAPATSFDGGNIAQSPLGLRSLLPAIGPSRRR
jgi:hypothetical protein